MEVTAQSQIHRAELDAVLESGIFNRAPNLSSFLTYICERHFEGAGDQIKEYNIAVEALGRPADFDQKKDSIVRVEAHRLRKRLAEYYATSGVGHPVKIVIPNGQYAPKFVTKDEIEPTVPAAVISVQFQPPPEIAAPTPRPRRPLPRIIAIAVLLIAAVAVSLAFYRGRGAPAESPAEVWHGAASDPVSSEFRMLAGYRGPLVTDRQGHQWQPDAYFNGGVSRAADPKRLIQGLLDESLLHTYREGDFHYDIPLRPGTYELHLLFADPTEGRPNNDDEEIRSFRLRINGQTRLDLFDPASEAGGASRLHVRVFKDVTPARDGKLHLIFDGQSGRPLLNALEILSGSPGKVRPIRLTAHKHPLTDSDGRVWAADEYAFGGHTVQRNSSILNSVQKSLFEAERFGNFSYRLPVAPGKYRITLHFAETYFGSQMPNAPAYHPGVRLFNVNANGASLLKDFDIAAAAGGPNRGVTRFFDGIEPNAQGLIVLEFIPQQNYACVNAIEVEEIE